MGKQSRRKRESKRERQSLTFPKQGQFQLGHSAIASLHQPAHVDQVKKLIRQILNNYPERIENEWLDYLSHGVLRIQIPQLPIDPVDLSLFTKGSPMLESKALGNFLAFQKIMSLIKNKFDTNENYPKSIKRLIKWGSESLHTYGESQAKQLALLANDIAEWCKQQSFTEALVIESPLGGTLPAAVIAKLLKSKGIKTTIKEFLAPRLESHSERFSIKKAAEEFVKDVPEGSYPIFYPDEMITGSRFYKLYAALKRSLGEDRLVPVAMEVLDQTALSTSCEKKKKAEIRLASVRNKLRNSRNGKRGAPVHCIFPPARLLKLDAGPPFVSNAPFYWGEVDYISGKRKVNLVFDLINEYKKICEDFRNPASQAIADLRFLWSVISNDFAYQAVQSVIKAAKLVDWNNIEEEARHEFNNEYRGILPPISNDYVYTRSEWIKSTIKSQLIKQHHIQIKPNESSFLTDALTDIFSLVVNSTIAFRRPRDRDFCEYTIPYANPLHFFHQNLIDLVLKELP